MHRTKRIRKALVAASLVGAASAGAQVWAQDTGVLYFNQDISMGGAPGIGGYTYDTLNNRFWTASFAVADATIRRIDTGGDPLSLTYNTTVNAQKWLTSGTFTLPPNGYNAGGGLDTWGVFEGDWIKYDVSTVTQSGTTLSNTTITNGGLSGNGGNGMTNVIGTAGQPTIGNIRMNPYELTVDGVTFAPGTLGVILDFSSITAIAAQGIAARPQDSKAIYFYDLRNLGGSTSVGPGNAQVSGFGVDYNNNGIVDWNDAFRTVATKKNFSDVAGATDTTTNYGRNFAFAMEGAGAGKYIYMVDSSGSTGGLWRVDLQTSGPAALKRIVNITADTTSISEPWVTGTSRRDFDPDSAETGDQVILSTSSANGGGVGRGGLAYVVHNTATDTTSEMRVLMHDSRLESFTGAAADIRNIVEDVSTVTPDNNGNLYFNDAGSGGTFKLDNKGRLVSVQSDEQRNSFQSYFAEDAVNDSVLDLQAREITINKDSASYKITEILYTDTSFDAPVGILAFKTGDFNRDGQITKEDTALFRTQLDLVVTSISPLLRSSRDAYSEYLKADLNGSALISGTAPNIGLRADAVNEKDLYTLFQFINKRAGDADLDGDIDNDDLAIVTANLNTAGNWTKGDFNRDGIVDATDVAMMGTIGTTYTLSGYDPEAKYVQNGGATWADVKKADLSGADDDSIVTIQVLNGGTVTGPAVNTRIAYLTLGGNIASNKTTLSLASGVTLTAGDGIFVKPGGEITGTNTSVIRLGYGGFSGVLAVSDGALTGGIHVQGNLVADVIANRAYQMTLEDGYTAASFTKRGAGTLVLETANSYTGTTTLFDGALQAADGVALPTASILQFRGGVLQSNGTFSRSLGTIAGTFNFSTGGGGFAAKGGAYTVNIAGGVAGAQSWAYGSTSFLATSQALILGSTTADNVVNFVDGLGLGTTSGTREVRIIDNAAVTTDVARISGAVTGGIATTTFLKTGAGTLELTGQNTYIGQTSVSAGRLIYNGTLSGAGGGVSVVNGATLGGRGQIARAVTVQSGGMLAPGSSADTLRTGNLTLAAATTSVAASTLAIEVGGAGEGQYDRVDVTGTVSLDGAVLSVTSIDGFLAGGLDVQKFFIITNDGADAVTGTMTGLGALNGVSLFVSYTGDFTTQSLTGGNDVVVYTPEPGGLAVLGLAGAAMLKRRRRRDVPEGAAS